MASRHLLLGQAPLCYYDRLRIDTLRRSLIECGARVAASVSELMEVLEPVVSRDSTGRCALTHEMDGAPYAHGS